MEQERRQHRRLDIHLPLECRALEAGPERAVRTVTCNISTSGLYFEVDLLGDMPSPQTRALFNIDLTVPPGDGYFPYKGQATGVAEVVRCDRLREPIDGESPVPARIGVAARFREPLKFMF